MVKSGAETFLKGKRSPDANGWIEQTLTRRSGCVEAYRNEDGWTVEKYYPDPDEKVYAYIWELHDPKGVTVATFSTNTLSPPFRWAKGEITRHK